MPRWLLNMISTFMVVALLPVTWAWWQIFRNYLAVRNREDLNTFALNKVARVTGLWIAQATLVTIALLSILFPQPRPEWVRITTTAGLVVLAISVAFLSLHEAYEIRSISDDPDEDLLDEAVGGNN